jgi:hypothetical protein
MRYVGSFLKGAFFGCLTTAFALGFLHLIADCEFTAINRGCAGLDYFVIGAGSIVLGIQWAMAKYDSENRNAASK